MEYGVRSEEVSRLEVVAEPTEQGLQNVHVPEALAVQAARPRRSWSRWQRNTCGPNARSGRPALRAAHTASGRSRTIATGNTSYSRAKVDLPDPVAPTSTTRLSSGTSRMPLPTHRERRPGAVPRASVLVIGQAFASGRSMESLRAEVVEAYLPGVAQVARLVARFE